MTKILFICHGNICRSPMAKYIMNDLIQKHGLEDEIEVESRATSREEIGSPVYPPARRELAKHNIICDGHQAEQITEEEAEEYDLLIVMDQNNLRNMRRLFGHDYDEKIHMMMSFTNTPDAEVADPWYYGNFDETYADVYDGCIGILKYLGYLK